MPRSQKPNGIIAPKRDFPIPLDLGFCPKRALQMELPFTGRSSQIGTEVPLNRQGQRGPGMHSRRLTKLLVGVSQHSIDALSDPPKVNVFSEYKFRPVQRKGKKSVLKARRAVKSSMATSPPVSTAASEFYGLEGG